MNCLICLFVRFEIGFFSKKTNVICAHLFQWSSVLSNVVTEQERMLPILLDLLDTNNEMELRPLTGLLRNLAKHSTNKDHTGKTQTGITEGFPVFLELENLSVGMLKLKTLGLLDRLHYTFI